MKIKNKTHWRTDQLRDFCTRVAHNELDTHKRKHVVVHFEYGREPWGHAAMRKQGHDVKERTSSSGCAYRGGWNMWVRLPRNTVDKVDFAHTIAHEMGHIRGMQHRQMCTSRYNRIGTWREWYAWAESLPLEKQPEKPKFKPTVDTKLIHVQGMLEKANTRLRRAKTIQKKWVMKVKYYERKLVVSKLN